MFEDADGSGREVQTRIVLAQKAQGMVKQLQDAVKSLRTIVAVSLHSRCRVCRGLRFRPLSLSDAGDHCSSCQWATSTRHCRRISLLHAFVFITCQIQSGGRR